MAELTTRVKTGKVRFSFPHLFKPHAAAEGAEAKYSARLLIPKTDTKTVSAIKSAIEAARLGSAPLFGGKVPERLKSPLRDGDGETPNGDEYGPECKGCWVLNASSKTRPGLVDRNLDPILDETEFYSGVYGRASLNFFAYNAAGNRGIACGLNNVQKLADGDPLGSRTRAEDDFNDGFEDEDADLGL